MLKEFKLIVACFWEIFIWKIIFHLYCLIEILLIKKKKLDLRQSETSLRKCKLIFYFSLRKMQINIRG